MKKIILSGLLAIFSFAVYAQDDVFRLSGNLEETGDTVKLYVVDLTQSNPIRQESIVVCENRFETTLDIDIPHRLLIYNTDSHNAISNRIDIFAIPKENLVLTGKWTDYTIDGSQFYKKYATMNKEIATSRNALIDLTKECMERLGNGESQEAVVAYYESTVPPLKQKFEDDVKDYLKSHQNSDESALLLSYIEEPNDVLDAYNVLNDAIKQGRMKPLLDVYVERANKELQQRENQKNIAEGKPAPEFTLDDINGNPLALSSLRGKFVVLDFWGSWCGWCIKGIPQMKEYYAKYNDKLEILGIDCGDTQEKWKEAVEKHQMPWKHVYNSEDSDITTTYAIQGYPTKIVIDPQGNIVKVVVGEDPAFYTYLDELFK